MEEVSGQACSAEDPELKLQDSPCADTVPVAHGKGKLKPRVYPSQTSSGKKSCPVQEMVPVQKANANQAKTMGGSIPQPRASSKSSNSRSCQTRTRSIPTSALATKLPVPVLRSIPKTNSPVTDSGSFYMSADTPFWYLSEQQVTSDQEGSLQFFSRPGHVVAVEAPPPNWIDQKNIPDLQQFQTGKRSMKIPEDLEVVKFVFLSIVQ
ncbi:PREDICTED: uncharacterized protein LOC107111160 [Gekko japonicus]|uniref:Uncharacterized protein LOC107111160 n=1 Tax=Gekko japonicus TaxID=146911 RepID=A0ABM1K1J0_GEKJA|nr:PREDICTED: uncharacterized protein LOC107111160 [Gekko japonicus]